MNGFIKLALCCLVTVNATNVMAQIDAADSVKAAIKRGQSDACISSAECEQARPKVSRLSVGGYGEVAYSRNF